MDPTRAAFTTTDLAAGGVLLTEQTKAFYIKAMEQQKLLPLVTTEFCSAQTKEIDILDFGSRKLIKMAEGVGAGATRKPTPSKVTVSLQKAGLPWEITEEAMAWNISGAQLEAKMFNGMSKVWGRDMEDLAVNGDTASLVDFLQFDEGWLELCKTGAGCNDFNGATVNGGVIVEKHFTDMMRQLPDQHQDFTPGTSLRFLMSSSNHLKWIEACTQRGDAAGTMALFGDSKVSRPLNIPIVTPVAWPNDRILLCNPKMLILAVDSTMRYDFTREGYTLVSSGTGYYILKQYVDFQVLDRSAIVNCYGMV